MAEVQALKACIILLAQLASEFKKFLFQMNENEFHLLYDSRVKTLDVFN